MAQNAHIANGSLAEHLYNYFSLSDVRNMLAEQPQHYELAAWDLSMEEYTRQINAAIAHIQTD